MQLIFLLFCVLLKARFAGVPRTLSNPPFLWFPCLASPQSTPFDILSEIAVRTDRIFQNAPFRYRFLYAHKCLLRCMVVVWFARRINAEAIVHFGMKKIKDDIKAHCWLTLYHGERAETETDNGYLEIWHYTVLRRVET